MAMPFRKLLVMGVAAITLGSGCATLTPAQKAQFDAMKADGMAVQEKPPAVGAALGVLPGCGSFYTHQWGLGVVDLLLWPYSVLWDPFAGYAGAMVINYEASRIHVRRVKAEQMADLDRQLETHQISQDDYIRRRRAIDAQFACYE
jgi:hypothetical protein